MRNLLTSANASNLGLLLARAPLGAFLLASGFEKFSKTAGVETFVQKFVSAIPAWVPHVAGEQVLRAIPYAEIVVGASLLFGILTRAGGLFATILLGLEMLALTGVRASGQPFQANVVYLGIALTVLLLGPGAISMDRFMWTGTDPRNESAKKPPAPSPAVRVRFSGRPAHR